MAVLTTQFLSEDFNIFNQATWQLLVEPKNLTALAYQNNQLCTFHQIGFTNNIVPDDINNISALAIRAGVQNLHFNYYTENYTLVPSELYNFNLKDDYINFLFGINDQNLIKSELNFSISSYLITTLNEELYRSLMVGVANTSVNCWHNSMINFAKQYKNHDDVAFVACFNNSYTITINKACVFTYMYSFSYTKPEEICYKLLHVFSVYNLNSTHCNVLLMGNVNAESFLYKELSKFFAQLSCINLTNYSKQIKHQLSVEDHQLFPALITNL